MAAPQGNSNAKKAREWRDQLKWALENYEGSNVAKGQALRAIAMRTVAEAIEGDKSARDEIANRLDGKHAQPIIGGYDDDPPVRVEEIVIRAVDAARD